MNDPKKCPVCHGKGKLPHNFYNNYSGWSVGSSLADVDCQSCNGKGIVWAPSFKFKTIDTDGATGTYIDNISSAITIN